MIKNQQKERILTNILVWNYSNKHVTINQGEYLGHLENIDEKENSHPHKNPDAHMTNNVTTKIMMTEQVEPDAFKPACHKLKPNIEAKLEAPTNEYESQLTRDETTIGTTPLKNVHRHRKLWTCITETLSNCHETLSMGKRWDWKATYSQSNQRKQIRLVSTHHSHTKRRWRKTFSNWLLSSQQSNKEIHLAYA